MTLSQGHQAEFFGMLTTRTVSFQDLAKKTPQKAKRAKRRFAPLTLQIPRY
jgi:hypothetical protein